MSLLETIHEEVLGVNGGTPRALRADKASEGERGEELEVPRTVVVGRVRGEGDGS